MLAAEAAVLAAVQFAGIYYQAAQILNSSRRDKPGHDV
jgi:hypothetical protein